MNKRKLGLLLLIVGVIALIISLIIIFATENGTLGLVLTILSIAINTIGATLMFNKSL
ncbi:MAG: hypothetical protein RR549_03445 [Oscillospiraceae bacterium]